MSVIFNSDSLMSLVEANKRAGITDNIGFLLELEQKHKALDVIPFYPASDNGFHKYQRAVKLGNGTWRALNEGRTSTRGASESVTFPVQIFSAESNIPDDTLRVAPDPIKTRNSEDLLIATGVVNDFMAALFGTAGNGSNPDAMKGCQYYRAKLGDYCLNAQGSGSKNTSIYVAEMGEYACNIRYNPKLTGDKHGIGLAIEDRGMIWRKDEQNRDMAVWKTTYDLTAALEVRQENALVRIANVNPASTFDANLFIDAINLLPSAGDNAVAFAPRPIYAQLMKFAFSQVSSNFTVETFENFGQVLKVMGIPILREDAILLNEATVSA